MRILASIASPIESITPAIEASVSTGPKNLIRAIRKVVYATSAIPARSQLIR